MALDLPPADLDALESVVRAYSARPPPADLVDLTDTLPRLRAAINALELSFARDAAHFAAGYEEDLFGNPSPYSWMRETCHMSGYAAVSAVCVGDTAPRLEQSTAALL